MAEQTEQAYAKAFARVMQLEEDRDAAITEWRRQRDLLMEEGKGDDVELMLDLVESAITLSALGEDSKSVIKARRVAQQAVIFAEAVASGVDPGEAEAILALGGDPRKTNPFGEEVSPSGFEF